MKKLIFCGIGFLLGAWSVFGYMRFKIFQEFSGMDFIKEPQSVSLRNELLDDLMLFPTIILLNLSFLFIVFVIASFLLKKKKN